MNNNDIHMNGLLFRRPPTGLMNMIVPGASVGFYATNGLEPNMSNYAQFFFEQGHSIALPWFADRGSVMRFKQTGNPLFFDDELVDGPWCRQPSDTQPTLHPDVIFVPLVAFTERGERLGQGGGHYDRWLAAHPHALAVGVAWDVQQADTLPVEAHDITLHTIVTQTRLYGPFKRQDMTS